MTIDKSIAELEVLKKNTFSYMSAHQAFITAIDTMRKYQKIVEIVGNYGFDTSWECLRQIRKVLEDGKIN